MAAGGEPAVHAAAASAATTATTPALITRPVYHALARAVTWNVETEVDEGNDPVRPAAVPVGGVVEGARMTVPISSTRR